MSLTSLSLLPVSTMASYDEFKTSMNSMTATLQESLEKAKSFQGSTDTDDLPRVKALYLKLNSLNSKYKEIAADIDATVKNLDDIFEGRRIQAEQKFQKSVTKQQESVKKDETKKLGFRPDKEKGLNPYDLGSRTLGNKEGAAVAGSVVPEAAKPIGAYMMNPDGTFVTMGDGVSNTNKTSVSMNANREIFSTKLARKVPVAHDVNVDNTKEGDKNKVRTGVMNKRLEGWKDPFMGDDASKVKGLGEQEIMKFIKRR